MYAKTPPATTATRQARPTAGDADASAGTVRERGSPGVARGPASNIVSMTIVCVAMRLQRGDRRDRRDRRVSGKASESRTVAEEVDETLDVDDDVAVAIGGDGGDSMGGPGDRSPVERVAECNDLAGDAE